MNSLTRYQFKTTITFIAPILSQSSGALRFGLDAAMLRDRSKKLTPAIPGTLIQGNLRQYLNELYSDEFKNGTFQFGKKPTDGQPQRGELSFSEFWTCSENKKNLIYFIALKLTMKKAKQKMAHCKLLNHSSLLAKMSHSRVIFLAGFKTMKTTPLPKPLQSK